MEILETLQKNPNAAPWNNAGRKHLGVWLKNDNTGQVFYLRVMMQIQHPTQGPLVANLYFITATGTD